MTSHSESRYLHQAARLCEWAKARKLVHDDIDMIVETVLALHSANDTLRAAKQFADTVRRHCAMQLAAIPATARACSPDAFDVLERAAVAVVTQIDASLSGELPEDDIQEADPVMHRYEVSSGRAQVTIRSEQPLTVDEVCQIALREVVPLGVPLSAIIEVVSADFGGPDDPVYVSTEVQLRNAGLLAEGRAL